VTDGAEAAPGWGEPIPASLVGWGEHPSTAGRVGGDAGIRTPCLLRAKQALYQMSYIPGWGILDSNQGPQSYQDCALTT
jgi:hypothetical protein